MTSSSCNSMDNKSTKYSSQRFFTSILHTAQRVWILSFTTTILATFCDSMVVKEETASFNYNMYDVTRVDDVVIGLPKEKQPIKNEDAASKHFAAIFANDVRGNAQKTDRPYTSQTSFKDLTLYDKRKNGDEMDGSKDNVNNNDNNERLENLNDGIIINCSDGYGVENSSNINITTPNLTEFQISCSGPNRTTSSTAAFVEQRYSTLYQTVACTLSAIIFVFGLLGNILVILVISRTRSMHTTTNCYLLSLSVADSLVLLAATLPAIPETFLRVEEWPYGRVMCSILIFLQYLGVDSSSLSITAFTIERYIAICHPMRAQTMCTVSRAKKIIAALWGFTLLYCSPWLGLTEIKMYPIPGQDPIFRCQHRLARSSYLLLYMIDLILFYVIPLIVAIILYLLIGRILFLSRSMNKNNIQFTGRGLPRKVTQRRTDSRVQVVRMLVIVVVVFACLWMPYRVMVVYNSFAQHQYMDLWFLLFARTMVYTNCAINPILYNILSVKFKRAFRNYLNCRQRRDSQTPSSCYNEMNTDVWATRRNTNNNTSRHQLQQQQLQHSPTKFRQLKQQQQHSLTRQYSGCTGSIGKDTGNNQSSIRSCKNSCTSNTTIGNGKKQNKMTVEEKLVYVHQQQKACIKGSSGSSSNNNSADTTSSLIENTV